jgi:O-acetyl-ADP-ribose deacetylase (regulator of RNase III)
VIHTVGPVWGAGSGEDEDELLTSCYLESLDLCDELGGRSIAFHSINLEPTGSP